MLGRLIALFLLVGFFGLPSCARLVRLPYPDGGHTIEADHESYWEAHHFPITIYIEETMTPEYKEAVYTATLVWNNMVDADVFRTEPITVGLQVPNADCGWIVVHSLPEFIYKGLWTANYDENAPTFCSGLITLQEGVEQSSMLKIAVHELGHGLGLAHDKRDVRSIMFPSIYADMPQYLMPDDVAAVRLMVDGKFESLSFQEVQEYRRILEKQSP